MACEVEVSEADSAAFKKLIEDQKECKKKIRTGRKIQSACCLDWPDAMGFSPFWQSRAAKQPPGFGW